MSLPEIKISGIRYHINYEAWQQHTDFFHLSREEFYLKYPKLKPIYPSPRVTLDEADKNQNNV